MFAPQPESPPPAKKADGGRLRTLSGGAASLPGRFSSPSQMRGQLTLGVRWISATSSLVRAPGSFYQWGVPRRTLTCRTTMMHCPAGRRRKRVRCSMRTVLRFL
jgi:hypothetical protein